MLTVGKFPLTSMARYRFQYRVLPWPCFQRIQHFWSSRHKLLLICSQSRLDLWFASSCSIRHSLLHSPRRMQRGNTWCPLCSFPWLFLHRLMCSRCTLGRIMSSSMRYSISNWGRKPQWRASRQCIGRRRRLDRNSNTSCNTFYRSPFN